MLVQRQRRWASIKSAVAECLVFAGQEGVVRQMQCVESALDQRLKTLAQHSAILCFQR